MFFSRLFNVGSGGTWPGEIALSLNKKILSIFFTRLRFGVILIAGTNGKTTTALMIKTVLEKKGYKVIHNKSGANLLNGLVSAFISQSSFTGEINADYGVFEVDENTLPHVVAKLKSQNSNLKTTAQSSKLIIVLLNLFRDQLDRYGEVDVIAEKWQKALYKLSNDTTVILNSDDPLVAYLGSEIKSKVEYFGLESVSSNNKNLEHATDSIFCLNCGSRLKYKKIIYSHLGDWKCEKCGLERPKPKIYDYASPLPGTYNNYNATAAAATLLNLGITEEFIKSSLTNFNPAFGRQEEFKIGGKNIKIFLSKNPAGFNESLRTVISMGAKHILFVLNDRIPDGRDISWIWDVDFEMIPKNIEITVSGDRAYDMAVRLKYAEKAQSSNLKTQNHNSKLKIFKKLREAIDYGLKQLRKNETLYILPTYSAMLEVRKIIKGRKIL